MCQRMFALNQVARMFSVIVFPLSFAILRAQKTGLMPLSLPCSCVFCTGCADGFYGTSSFPRIAAPFREEGAHLPSLLIALLTPCIHPT